MKIKAKPKIAALALACAFAIPITAPISTTTAQASGIPTVDVVAIAQAILEVMESIQQTTSLMEQYETQLQQYENQLQHSLAPAAYIWEQASITMSKLEAAQAMLDVYDSRLGGLEGYLNQFIDVNWYKRSPCFSKNGCTPEELKAMREVQERMREAQSQAQFETNQAAAKATVDYQKTIDANTKLLAQIKSQASRARGHLQAIGAGNQLAGFQGDQLISINQQLATLIQLQVRQSEYEQQQREIERQTALKTRDTSRFQERSPLKGW